MQVKLFVRVHDACFPAASDPVMILIPICQVTVLPGQLTVDVYLINDTARLLYTYSMLF